MFWPCCSTSFPHSASLISSRAVLFIASRTFRPRTLFFFFVQHFHPQKTTPSSNPCFMPILAGLLRSAAFYLGSLSTPLCNSVESPCWRALLLSTTPVRQPKPPSAAVYALQMCCILRSTTRSLSAHRIFKNSGRPLFILTVSSRPTVCRKRWAICTTAASTHGALLHCVT